MIVAFAGNDGSGKTTVRNLLVKRLQEEGFSVEVVLGFEHLWIDSLKRAGAFLMGKDLNVLQEEYNRGAVVNNKKSIINRIWPYIVLLDFSLLALSKVKHAPKHIVLFDRFAYDYACSFDELGYGDRLVKKMFQYFPKPRYVFIFDASPEIAYARKKHDHKSDIRYYQRQRLRYLRLARLRNFPIKNSDSVSAEALAGEIFEQIAN